MAADASVTVFDEKKASVGSVTETTSADEKHSALSVTETTSATSQPLPSGNDNNLDEAFKYLHGHTDAESADIDLAALRRRIDWRIVPIMFACYILQFLDKVVINYAAVMGIRKDLRLINNDFTNVGSAFFIAYLIAEIPNGYILQKVPAGKWLGINVALWGVACAAAAGATDYRSLLVARIFLGMFEAAIAPCLMLISSQYYTKNEQAPRFALWYSGLGVGQILGGLVSYVFQHVTNSQLKAWQAMFIFIGLLTVVVGIATYFILPDSPMTAKWLSDSEKAALLRHVSVNQTGVKNTHFKWEQGVEVLRDPQLWLLTICTICISVSSGVVTTYSATLIQSFGFTPKRTALLNMPSGAISIAAALIVGFGVRKAENRWAWLALCCVPGIIGGGLMSFMPSTNRVALLVGIYLVNAITGTLTVIYQWTMANVAGHTKRTIAAALIAGSFSIGNIIGPQTFQARDAPQFHPAKIAVLATQASGALVSITLFGYYVWANRQKDKRQAINAGLASSAGDEQILWENLTDFENPNFRYVY